MAVQNTYPPTQENTYLRLQVQAPSSRSAESDDTQCMGAAVGEWYGSTFSTARETMGLEDVVDNSEVRHFTEELGDSYLVLCLKAINPFSANLHCPTALI